MAVVEAIWSGFDNAVVLSIQVLHDEFIGKVVCVQNVGHKGYMIHEGKICLEFESTNQCEWFFSVMNITFAKVSIIKIKESIQALLLQKLVFLWLLLHFLDLLQR